MMWFEQKAYADIICEAFTADEIQRLEVLAEAFEDTTDGGW